MTNLNEFKLLTANALRIFWRSKALVFQLIFLLFIGFLILITAIFSNLSLSESKQSVLLNSNLADFSVSIPNTIRESSNTDNNLDGDQLGNSNLPGYTNADKELKAKLDELGLTYSLTKMSNAIDILSQKSFILSSIDSQNLVNKVVKTQDSADLPQSKINNDVMVQIVKQYKYFKYLTQDKKHLTNDQNIFNDFKYETYLANKPWELAQALMNYAIWNLDEATIHDFVELIEPLAKQPKDLNDYNTNYNIYKNNNIKEINTDSLWHKWNKKMGINGITYNGFGFTLDARQYMKIINSQYLPFGINIYDTSSLFGIISTDFLVKNPDKSYVNQKTINSVINLPYHVNNVDENTKLYPVWNEQTQSYVNYPDIYTWMNDLDDKYKIKINSLDYVLIGAGISANLLYPVLNKDQLLVDSKNNGVVYLSDAGFERARFGDSAPSDVYYSVSFPQNLSSSQRNEIFSELQDWTTQKYGQNTVFYTNDPNQENYLIYIRANFLNELQSVISLITYVIAGIIIFLSIIFSIVLVNSIVKKNGKIFAINLANGVNKLSLIVSFFPFALIPGLIAGISALFVSYGLVIPLNSIFAQYWTLPINNPDIIWWLIILVPIVVIGLLTIICLLVLVFRLSKDVNTLLNDNYETKVNVLTRILRAKSGVLPVLWQFRLNFAFSNIFRFVVLTFTVFCLVSLSVIIVGSINQFNNALIETNKSKNYSYAVDLYSPTINAGYYSAMPFEELGISQQGIYNNYNSDGITGNYKSPSEMSLVSPYSGKQYNDALKYPYGENKYFTSLFMPSINVSTELNQSITFFNNKLFTMLDINIDLVIDGRQINAWELAKQVLPLSILNLAENYMERQVSINHEFYYWLQTANQYANQNEDIQVIPSKYLMNGKPIKYTDYLPEITEQPFTFDGSDLTEDIDNPQNLKSWIYIKKVNAQTGKKVWALNDELVVKPNPSFLLKPKAAKLLVLMLTNDENPVFNYWFNNVYDKKYGSQSSYNYKLGLGMIPVENNDETYSYLTSYIVNKNNQELTNPIKSRIVGIKPNSKFVKLIDNNNNLMNNLLFSNVENNTYPIIINRVVNRKYGLNVGDELTVHVTNTFDRFNRKNLGIQTYNSVKLKVVGINETKSEEQFFIAQENANKILGYQNPETFNENWNGPFSPGKDYVPFNGVFLSDPNAKLINNYGGIYSPSGLSVSLPSWNTNIGANPGQTPNGELKNIIKDNYKKIDDLSRINLVVDYDNDNNQVVEIPKDKQNPLTVANPSTNDYGDVVRRIVNIFESRTPVVSSLQNVDSPLINQMIGPKLDETILNIETIVLCSMIPTLLIIILLLASTIIIEAQRLIAMLKVMGYSNAKNLFSFLFVYLLVLVLGTILAIPFSLAILSIFSSIVFTALNIIISPIMPVWIWFATIGAILLIFGTIFIYLLFKVEHWNLATKISFNS